MVMKNPYKNKNILVLGLAKSGFYAAKLLHHLEATVTVNDAKNLADNPDAQELESLGVRVISGGHPSNLLDEGFDFLVKNPGIPYENKLVIKAMDKNIPVITEVEVAQSVMPSHIIGVTGTNGKTTTSSIIQEMLSLNRKAGAAYAIGNIGVPASKVALKVKEEDDLVIELSSFQLMGTPTIQPEIAVITNITAAHLDYHGSKEAYENAKLNLIRNQTKDDVLIYNADQAQIKERILAVSQATKYPFSSTRYLKEGISVKNDSIYFKEEKIADVSDIFLSGQHNLENFLAAVGVAKVKNVANDRIQKVMHHFTGVKHRTQFVVEWNKRTFYNDSKATNIEATEMAITGFEQPVILLAGGLDRGRSYEPLIPSLEKHVKGLVTFGETADSMIEVAKQAGIKKTRKVPTMEEAVKVAYEMSDSDDIILLSPAAASWDQYKNFEVRGDAFIEAINNLMDTESI